MNRDDLIKQREELKARLEAIRRDLGGGLQRDLEEQAQQLENQDALVEIARVTQEELEKLERRIEALDEGQLP